MERDLIGWYRELISQVLDRATEENLPRALEIAALPDQIRGYEQIKEASIAQARKRAVEMLADLQRESSLAKI
jgi:indolepyruvate ferredoxin oxidoreductase